MSYLFQPYSIKKLELKNRIVMAPMCLFCAPETGMVTDFHVLHYATRAVGGVGLIMLEATAVCPEGRITSSDLGIWDDAHMEGLRKIVDVVHANGSKIGIQLGHAGRKCTAAGMRVEAPSAIPFDADSPVPHEMTRGEIAQTVEEFRQAAVRAWDVGFDMIQIHAAHGYLLSEFLSPLCNKRTDEYGGSPENRVRILGEVLDAVGTVREDGPIEVRVSAEDYQEGGNIAKDLAEMLHLVKDRGIDSINVSTGGVVQVAPVSFPGYQLSHAETIRKETGLPVVAGGLIRTAREAEEILEKGIADQVYLGRVLLRDPYFALHARMDLGEDPQPPTPYRRAYR